MATIYQVAQAAGVSLATVSRVMNGNARVSDKTKEKVHAAMAELGYRPNSIAQSLASNRSNRVGVVVSVLDGPFFGNMLAEIEQVLRDAGKHAIITAGHGNEEQEKDAVEFLLSCNCDALILCIDALDEDYLVDLQQRVPLAIINQTFTPLADQCFVVDNELGGYLATKAVIEAGHRDIAYISGPSFKDDAMLRLQGHQRALQEAGLTLNNKLVYEGDYHEAGGRAGFSYFKQSGAKFTAVVCGNDEMASGVLLAGREADLRMSTDLSVVGFDDLIFARYTYPTLSTVQNPIKQMGQMAAFWVLKTLYEQTVPVEITNSFEPRMIIRDSIIKQ